MNSKSVFLGRLNKGEIAGSILLVAICVLPFFTFASTKKIFVNASTSGNNEDGSSKHPYKKIKDALEHAKSGTEVIVAKGTYGENIEIPSGVKVLGNDKDDVVIDAKNNDKPAVKMHNKTELDKVTIKNGKEGVEVDDGDKASIIKCVIKNNDKDGIKIGTATVNDKHKVVIEDNIIRNNGKNGIFSEKRRLILIDNEILNNGSDGVGVMPGSKAWIAGNRIKDNDGSGMRINIDGSDIWTKNNTYRENDREGIEVDSNGGSGRIDINKSKFWDNKRWAIARIQKSGNSTNWNGVTIQGNNEFIQSRDGNISPIIYVN